MDDELDWLHGHFSIDRQAVAESFGRLATSLPSLMTESHPNRLWVEFAAQHPFDIGVHTVSANIRTGRSSRVVLVTKLTVLATPAMEAIMAGHSSIARDRAEV